MVMPPPSSAAYARGGTRPAAPCGRREVVFAENRLAPAGAVVEQPLPKVKPQPPRMSKVFSAYSRWVRGDHEAVLVVRDRHHLVHLLDLRDGHADLLQHGELMRLSTCWRACACASPASAERAHHRRRVAGGQQVGEVLDRDAQLVHVGHLAGPSRHGRLRPRLDRRQRRHVPDHRQRAVFRVQREGDLPFHRHLVDRRLRARRPATARARRRGAPGRSPLGRRVEEDVELRVVELALVLDARRLLDPVGVVQHARRDSGCGRRRSREQTVGWPASMRG